MDYLHIHCGDASARPLQSSSVPGDVRVWREIYVEGPVPGNLPDKAFRRVRAKFISREMGMDYDDVLKGTNDRYEMLAGAGRYGEVVLWFDSCMFDQTIMAHVISLCSRQQWPDTKLSLICIDRGLGELSVDELVSLMDVRREVTREQIGLADDAWAAFTSADPTAVEAFLERDSAALPFLADALRRHLQQFPSVVNGLNRTQAQILSAVAGGATKPDEIFRAVSDMEERPFMGDTSCWSCIDELAECPHPVLHLSGPGRLKAAVDPAADIDSPAVKDIKRWNVSLTDMGRDVLAGEGDFVRLNGIDRWLGGVHLCGPDAPWRWDEQAGTILLTYGDC